MKNVQHLYIQMKVTWQLAFHILKRFVALHKFEDKMIKARSRETILVIIKNFVNYFVESSC